MTPRITESFPPRLSPEQAERFTGMSPRKLKRLRQARAVKFYRAGHRTIVYDRDSLQRWLASREVPALETNPAA